MITLTFHFLMGKAAEIELIHTKNLGLLSQRIELAVSIVIIILTLYPYFYLKLGFSCKVYQNPI